MFITYDITLPSEGNQIDYGLRIEGLTEEKN